jgi:hypothetical protein
MLKYTLLVVGAFFVAGLIGWLPASWLQPFRAVEIRLLYLASTQGPAGADDGVLMQIVNHPTRYADPLMKMLKSAKPGTSQEEVALYFIELVRGPAAIDVFLAEFAQKHSDPQVRRFVQDVINSPTPQEILARRQ